MEPLASSRFEKLVTAVQQLSMARNIDRVMEIVRTVSRQLTSADGATFVLREGDDCFYADEEAISTLFKGHRFPMQMCISGWSMLHKEHVVIKDIYKDNRIPHEVYRPTFVKSLLMVPIRRLDPIGAIGNYWATEHEPSAEEISLLQSLADTTAVALENIRVYEQLEQRVQARTRDLEAMNRDLEAFSYSVSHDLRAPLRAINGYMELLVQDHSLSWDEDAKRLGGRVLANAREMEALINSLLAFFKMGQEELEKTKVDMQQLVNEVSQDLQAQEKDRNINIAIHNLPEVMADNALMRQVWQNLISNALKYTARRPNAQIEISSLQSDGQTQYYIKDNGAGFDMNYYSKLFGVFQRLHSQREFDGSGIGLATVDKIIKKHGGQVWAKGEVNQGATFYFTLGE